MIQPPKTSKEPKRRGRGRYWRNSPKKKKNIGCILFYKKCETGTPINQYTESCL